MMNRRHILVAAAGLFLASSSLAQADEVGDIVHWLRQLGFGDITTSRSLLGRVQIRATGDIGTRELVVNPRTGEILRDVWLDNAGNLVRGKPYVRAADDSDDSGHSGSGGGDDGRGSSGGDDDTGHGGGGDDNSGSGGGDDNSGSGGGDSGSGGGDHDGGSDDGGGSDHGGDSNDD